MENGRRLSCKRHEWSGGMSGPAQEAEAAHLSRCTTSEQSGKEWPGPGCGRGRWRVSPGALRVIISVRERVAVGGPRNRMWRVCPGALRVCAFSQGTSGQA